MKKNPNNFLQSGKTALTDSNSHYTLRACITNLGGGWKVMTRQAKCIMGILRLRNCEVGFILSDCQSVKYWFLWFLNKLYYCTEFSAESLEYF